MAKVTTGYIFGVLQTLLIWAFVTLPTAHVWMAALVWVQLIVGIITFGYLVVGLLTHWDD